MSTRSADFRSFLYWFFWFAIFNLALVQLASVLYFGRTGQMPETAPAWAFFFIYWCGHLFSLIFIFFLGWSGLVAIGPRALMRVSVQRWALAAIFAFIVAAVAADTIVYTQYRFHINLLVLDLYFHSKGQVIEFVWQMWAEVAAVVGVLLAIEVFAGRWLSSRLDFLRERRLARKVLAFYLFCLVTAHLSYIFADAMFYGPITRLGYIFPFSAPAQAQSFLAKHGFVDVEEYKKRRAMRVGAGTKKLHYPLAPLACGQPAKKPNIVWILVDALRSDMITEDVMPNAFKFRDRAQVFQNHYSGSNTTRYGIFNIFYGLPGLYFDAAMGDNVSPVFMDELQKRDYQFGIYGSAPLFKPEFDQTVFSKIPNLRTSSKADTDYGRDIEITDLFKDFLHKSDRSKPFFGFLFYDSTHGYSVPPNFVKKFQPTWFTVDYLKLDNNTDPTPFRNLYKNSANFVDGLIGQVLAAIEKENLADDTIILVSSDHGQEFNDNHLNYWGHNSNYSDVQTHVPLLIYWPGREHKEYSQRTDHYDIAPTFLQEIFSCTTPSREYSSGDNLFKTPSHEWIVMGRSTDFAVYRDHDIVVVDTSGNYDVVDHTYHPIKDAKLDGAAVLPALDELRRFF